jgi:hypothetical protein
MLQQISLLVFADVAPTATVDISACADEPLGVYKLVFSTDVWLLALGFHHP